MQGVAFEVFERDRAERLVVYEGYEDTNAVFVVQQCFIGVAFYPLVDEELFERLA
jgi:hypothetical protein